MDATHTKTEIVYKDTIHSQTRFEFDFKDRLKVLFGAQMHFSADTKIELILPAGETRPHTICKTGEEKLWFTRPKWMWKKRPVYLTDAACEAPKPKV